MNLQAIKEAITELAPEDKTRLAGWLLRQDLEEWDRQIEEDFSPGGAGMALLKEAQADVREGRVKPLDDFLSEARTKRRVKLNPQP